MKMETMMEEGEEDFVNQEETDWNYELDITQLCRICANPNEYLIPIFHGEGLEHELKSKISRHLPIKVAESDNLPTNLCYQCASTLIAWHDMVVGCLEADEKLRALLPDNGKEAENGEKNDTGGKPVQRTSEPIVKTDMKVNSMPRPLEEIKVEVQQVKLSTPNEVERVVVEEEVTSFQPEFEEEVTSDSKCLEPFRAYHQTQIAVRMQQWVTNGPVFCMFCGQMKESQSMMIKHFSVDHKIQCGHCRACFTSKQQLAVHMALHNSKETSKTDHFVGQKLEGDQKRKNTCGTNKDTKDSQFVSSEDFRATKLKSRCRKQLGRKQVCSTTLPRKNRSKTRFHCDKCPLLFSRRVDLAKHLCTETLNLVINKNGSTSNKFSHTNKLDKVLHGVSEDFLDEKSRSDIEDDMNLMNYSDDSVKSEDISRHLDVKPQFSVQPMSELISSGQLYSCSMCDFACTKKTELTAHRHKEHGTEIKKLQGTPLKNVSVGLFPCTLCSNSYSRNSDLMRHVLKKHGGEKLSRRCVDSVDDMDVELINKAKEVINGITVYRCEVCNKSMITKRGYVRHVRTHTGERPFTCHVCGKQYRSSTDLSRHLKCVHDGVKNYPCDVCGRCFANKGTRNDHRRTHTGEKPFVCHICGKSFPTQNSIYVHRRTHTDVFPHSCTTCNKKFRRRQQLIHHIRIHTGEKPHACDICGKYFRVKDEVSRHRLTHSNEKPHVCPVCGICFAQKRYLSNHTKTHHSRLM